MDTGSKYSREASKTANSTGLFVVSAKTGIAHPRYKARKPSLDIVALTQSTAEDPCISVCNRVFTVSKGCPIATVETACATQGASLRAAALPAPAMWVAIFIR